MNEPGHVDRCPVTEEDEFLRLLQEGPVLPDDGYRPRLSENQREFAELRHIFDSLGAVASCRIEAELDAAPDATREQLAVVRTHVISYDNQYVVLPPNLFGDEIPFLPGNKQETEALAAGYTARLGSGSAAERALAAKPNAYGQTFAEHIAKKIDTARIYGHLTGIDPDGWQTYQQTYLDHKAIGTEKYLYALWEYREREIGKNTPAYADRPSKYDKIAGRFEKFVYAGIDIGTADAITTPSTLMMPVGEYGEAAAATLVKATAHVMLREEEVIAAETEQYASENTALLQQHTARGRSEVAFSPHKAVTGKSPRGTMQEGALSVLHALGQLTPNKVPGYESFDDLLVAIVDQGLLERYTRKVTMGMVGPYTVKGTYFPNPLYVNEHNELDFTPEFAAFLDVEHEEYVASVLASLQARHDYFREYPNDPPEEYVLHGLGIMCPAAGKNGAVRKAAETIKQLYLLDKS